MRPYLENVQHKTGLVEWLKWSSACLAHVKLSVQIPEPPPKKKKKKKRQEKN
jgi:hypothetical protein